MVYAGTKDGKEYGFYLDTDGLTDYVELSKDEYIDLINGSDKGDKVISFHAGGVKPTLEDPPEPEPPTDEVLAKQARHKRDQLIDDQMWRVQRYQTQRDLGITTTDSESQYNLILAYIQQLRDVPSQTGFPRDIHWPTLTL